VTPGDGARDLKKQSKDCEERNNLSVRHCQEHEN
jgi:hypothetical protein